MDDEKIYELWTTFYEMEGWHCGYLVSKGNLEDMMKMKSELDLEIDRSEDHHIVSPSDIHTYSSFKKLFSEQISGMTVLDISDFNLVGYIDRCSDGRPICCYVYDLETKTILRPLIGDELLEVIISDPSIFCFGIIDSQSKINELKTWQEKNHEHFKSLEKYSHLYTDE